MDTSEKLLLADDLVDRTQRAVDEAASRAIRAQYAVASARRAAHAALDELAAARVRHQEASAARAAVLREAEGAGK
jgi:hypothetical protein